MIILKEYLDKIQAKCITPSTDDHYIQLGLGKIVFLAHYAPDLLSYDVLEQVVDTSTRDSTHSLCSGSLAVALLIRDLCAKELLDPSELAELNDSADRIYQQEITRHTINREYDLFTGLVGKGIYFLAARNDALVATIVRALDTFKLQDEAHYYWLDSVQSATKCDLGLAHGVPSIVAFLADCYRHGIEAELSRKLLTHTVAFLLAQQGKPAAPYLFPTGLNTETGAVAPSSRLAWCYGDLGVAAALWRAGSALQCPQWQEAALAIMLQASEISLDQANVFSSARHGVLDTGFCHGTAGIAHLFHRFYQVTQREELLRSAHYWLELTLRQLDRDELLFPVDVRNDQWVEHSGLLEGYAGVGMVLLTFLEPAACADWDTSFLTNIA
ncbi:hypothetical protein E5K00_10060 [Hymenobacter aquaticus]|uniref:Lanthionine synthetase n=1 Tax=Hymenobacter aquaticus TaxID=1867101 RepID=A0A4Z0Q9V3_9BACT|nr:lanthionine synthetase C family protein [Hymenobacter aquaticus]TGE25512.1 hypothetical protein E5K00_10060 [Hymenobacter aquaticus]